MNVKPYTSSIKSCSLSRLVKQVGKAGKRFTHCFENGIKTKVFARQRLLFWSGIWQYALLVRQPGGDGSWLTGYKSNPA